MLAVSRENSLAWHESFAHYFLGLSAYERNDPERALAHCEIVRLDPYRHPVNYVVFCSILSGFAYLALGRADDAVSVADFLKTFSVEQNNVDWIELADAFFAETDLRLGNLGKAASRAIRPHPAHLRRTRLR